MLPPSPAVYVILTLSLILSGAVTIDDDDAVDDSSSHSGVGCMLIILLLPAPPLTMVAEVEDEVTGKHAMSPDVDSDAMDPNGSSLLELTYRLRASNGVTTRLLHNTQGKTISLDSMLPFFYLPSEHITFASCIKRNCEVSYLF